MQQALSHRKHTHHNNANAEVSYQRLSPKNNVTISVNDGMPKNAINDIYPMIVDEVDDIDNIDL